MVEEVWLTATGELIIMRWFNDDHFRRDLNKLVRQVLILFGGECLGLL